MKRAIVAGICSVIAALFIVVILFLGKAIMIMSFPGNLISLLFVVFLVSFGGSIIKQAVQS